MCSTPTPKKAQQFQTAQAPVFAEGTEDDLASKRGRRGTILATAMQAPAAAAGGKQLSGQ